MSFKAKGLRSESAWRAKGLGGGVACERGLTFVFVDSHTDIYIRTHIHIFIPTQTDEVM